MESYSAYDANVAGTAADYARDYLQGCRKDYLFFRTSTYDYVLIVADRIDFSDHSDIHADYADIITFVSTIGDERSATYHMLHDHDEVSVSIRGGVMAYASDRYFPHLVSGGEHYAFAQTFLFSVCFALYGFMYIFNLLFTSKRSSRRR